MEKMKGIDAIHTTYRRDLFMGKEPAENEKYQLMLEYDKGGTSSQNVTCCSIKLLSTWGNGPEVLMHQQELGTTRLWHL